MLINHQFNGRRYLIWVRECLSRIFGFLMKIMFMDIFRVICSQLDKNSTYMVVFNVTPLNLGSFLMCFNEFQ